MLCGVSYWFSRAAYINAQNWFCIKPTSLDMKRRSKHFMISLNLTYIAEIFISGFSEITTICGSAPSNAEVWIKVCNLHSRKTVVDCAQNADICQTWSDQKKVGCQSRPLWFLPSLQSCLAQGANIPLIICFLLVWGSLFIFLDRKLGIYPKHFSGLSPSLLIPSWQAENLS